MLNHTWEVWKTVQVGDYGSPAEIERAIEETPATMSPGARAAIEDERFLVSQKRVEHKIVRASPHQLGFTSWLERRWGVPYEWCCNRARFLGLEPTSLEAAALLRREYPEQAKATCDEDMLPIASKPILSGNRGGEIFALTNYEDEGLRISVLPRNGQVLANQMLAFRLVEGAHEEMPPHMISGPGLFTATAILATILLALVCGIEVQHGVALDGITLLCVGAMLYGGLGLLAFMTSITAKSQGYTGIPI